MQPDAPLQAGVTLAIPKATLNATADAGRDEEEEVHGWHEWHAENSVLASAQHSSQFSGLRWSAQHHRPVGRVHCAGSGKACHPYLGEGGVHDVEAVALAS